MGQPRSERYEGLVSGNQITYQWILRKVKFVREIVDGLLLVSRCFRGVKATDLVDGVVKHTCQPPDRVATGLRIVGAVLYRWNTRNIQLGIVAKTSDRASKVGRSLQLLDEQAISCGIQFQGGLLPCGICWVGSVYETRPQSQDFVYELILSIGGSGPCNALRSTFHGKDKSSVEGKVQNGPDLLTDGAEAFLVDPVKVDHVQEVQVQHCAEYDARHRSFERKGGIGECHVLACLGCSDGTLSEDDQGQEGHAFDQVCSVEADVAPVARCGRDRECFGNTERVPLNCASVQCHKLCRITHQMM